MPVVRINGAGLGYDEYGSGEPVVMVAGTGAPGRIWRTHQVPALKAAGYRVITFDNRGIRPDGPARGGFTLDDMVADVAGLIEHLGAGPCRVVGHSLGGIILQELLVSRPELVERAVLVASSGRTDAALAAMSAADIELSESGITLPPRYAAYITAVQNLSPQTLNDDEQLQDWLGVFEMSAVDVSGARRQLGLDVIPDRLAAYRRISRPCLVVGFQDDLVVRPHLSREVATAIPGATYTEIPGCGHYGYLERPAALNQAITDFFAQRRG
uniref:Putative alpha/beta hydrolase n=1 Tax=Streptomyces sp. DSM 11171 TaxID=1740725 RepID=A0A0P0KP66_9ACTN|nr:putative alpha/beta hydrolase [Streptomyces sp. DSM 11171]